jgi:hypothetical protein
MRTVVALTELRFSPVAKKPPILKRMRTETDIQLG